MALGDKLFEETGKLTNFNVKSVHPIEGVKMEGSFASEIKGSGNFPSGRNMGSGTMRQYPHGIVDASYEWVVTTSEGEQFFWWAHEKSKVAEGGKTRGLVTVTGFTNSKKLSGMNSVIVAIDAEFDPTSQQYKGTGYEWK